MIELDSIDRKILTTLQRDGALSQRDVASKVGLSQNACWRRVKRLNELGVIEGYGARLNAKLVGLDLTVFMMIKTRWPRPATYCWGMSGLKFTPLAPSTLSMPLKA